jgi:hypothetical protein
MITYFVAVKRLDDGLVKPYLLCPTSDLPMNGRVRTSLKKSKKSRLPRFAYMLNAEDDN